MKRQKLVYGVVESDPSPMISFSPQQLREICSLLGNGAGYRELNELHYCLSSYLRGKSCEQQRVEPSQSQIRKELSRVSSLADELRTALDSISADAWVFLQSGFYRQEKEYPFEDAGNPEAVSHVNFPDVDAILGRLAAAGSDFEVQRGRPKKWIEWMLLLDFGRIWKSFRGEPPRRSCSWDTGEETGEFRRFVEVCLQGLPDEVRPSVPDGLIRRYCEEERAAQQRKPTKAEVSQPPERRPRIFWAAPFLESRRMEKKRLRESGG